MFSGAAPRLRVESVNGLPINDYRIRGDEVEIRTFPSPRGKPVRARPARNPLRQYFRRLPPIPRRLAPQGGKAPPHFGPLLALTAKHTTSVS